jgi:hypothetical protein
MAQVAAVFTIAAFIRKPEDIVTELGPTSDTGGKPVVRPRPEHKRVWASVDKPAKVVIERMFEEALRRDPARDKCCVALVDGNLTQLALLKKMSKRQGVAPTIVLDVIHVLEYVSKAVPPATASCPLSTQVLSTPGFAR